MKYDDDYKYYVNRDDNSLANRFRNAMIEPEKAVNGEMVGNTHDAVMIELHSDLQGARYSYYKRLINEGKTHQEAMAILKNPDDETIDKLFYYGNLSKNFKPTTTWEEKKELIKLLPAFTGVAGTAGLAGLASGSNVQQQVRKHGGKINKHKSLKLYNMTNKYEYGGRIGDETFNVGNLKRGTTSGDSLRTLLNKNNKIRVSTKQPKWALNNGSINNSSLQSKPKSGQSTEMKKLGGRLKKYQLAGQTAISNLNNTMRTRGSAGYSPITGKPNFSNNFDLNPNISYGNPKGWGQVYGNANITRTPVFNQNLFSAGYNKKNLGTADLNYKDINGDKTFGANVNVNRGYVKAVGTADIGKDKMSVGTGLEYNSPLIHGGINYNYNKNTVVPGGVHGLSGSLGNDRFNIMGNKSIDVNNPANNSTNIVGGYNGPKGGYVKGGYYQNQHGRSGSIEGGYKGKNGNISGNINYGNGFNSGNISGEYLNTYDRPKGNKLTVGVKGSMNVNKYQIGGDTRRQLQSANAPEFGGYSLPNIPDKTYYATPQSTDTNLKQSNRVNAIALAKKRANEAAIKAQGTITRSYNDIYPMTGNELREKIHKDVRGTLDKTAKVMHVTAQGTSDLANLAINGESPDINRYLDPKLDRPISKTLGIKNKYIAPVLNLGVDLGNYVPLKWIGHIEKGGNALKTMYNVGKHTLEQGLLHPLTNPAHGPANYYTLGTKTKVNPNYDEEADYKERYNRAYEDWKKYRNAKLQEYPKGQYYINNNYVTPQEYNNAKKYVGVTDYQSVMPKYNTGGKLRKRF